MSGRPYAEVIGDPVAHSKSPTIHNFWLGKLAIDAEYRRCHVRAEELADYFARRRGDAAWRGCNVTIPHKVAILRHVDEVDWHAREAGASNCVTPASGLLCASSTDGHGVDAAIDRATNTACIIGCGGAARAALATLEVLATMEIRLIARDEPKASALLKEFGYPPRVAGFGDAVDQCRGVDLLINASPLGMSGQAPMPQTVLDAIGVTTDDCIVFDMVYAPVETELLTRAQMASRQTRDGLVMLVAQAAVAFEKFFGAPAPREHDAELRGLLTS